MTLLELLIVTGILAILAGLTFPVYRHARMQSWRAACSGNLRQMGLAVQMYAQDSAYRMPSCRGYGSEGALPEIRTVLLPYLDNAVNIFRCPGDFKYFPLKGSSFEWNALANGKLLDEKSLTLVGQGLLMPILFDVDNFHGPSGNVSSKNYLYLPASVRSELIYSK